MWQGWVDGERLLVILQWQRALVWIKAILNLYVYTASLYFFLLNMVAM